MKVAVFGATGTIGNLVVKQALAAGHDVTAFCRTPSKLTMESSQLRVVQGDVLRDTDQISATVRGQDAVIIALGAGIKGQVRSVGTRNIIDAMQQTGVSKLICQSTLGAGDSSALLNLKWWFIFRGPLRWAMADHEKQERYVRESGLDWTIVRPSAFTDGPLTTKYKHGNRLFARNLTLTISRADVAHFLLGILGNDAYRSQAVSLTC